MLWAKQIFVSDSSKNITIFIFDDLEENWLET